MANSMAILNSTIVLEEGTTFVFGSWVSTANSLCGFNSHLANPRELEASVSTSTDNINDLASDLG
jgi:hypothetical protein